MIFSTIISLGTGDTTLMLGYAGDLMADLLPIWLPIVAVGLGLIAVVAVIGAIRGH
jgi:hypothetical protein